VSRCAPADYTVFDPASEQVGWASVPLIVVGRTDLGVTSAFNFLEDTLVLSGATVTGVDLAPDTGSYNYTLTGLAPPPAPPDTTPPNTRITSAPARVARAARATFGFRSTERGSTFLCRLDRRAWRRCTSPTTFRRPRARAPYVPRPCARCCRKRGSHPGDSTVADREAAAVAPARRVSRGYSPCPPIVGNLDCDDVHLIGVARVRFTGSGPLRTRQAGGSDVDRG
jgi:hypothetical protein